ncbi:outer membrane protein assembly factor BamA [Moraxella caviae]|uniref:Outer membrane protein assembly factor BamA n=1 Tax=Moraxella caviae TaxID=34060 RepID=A0A1T0A2M7_9GAMM|nr:outer membrane protein assembly factor BamA [Moraxella caviae]OOR89937.1 outer membrane protein assembly factor BamA [Moraxella caviae]STZ14322.1 Omp85 [Moraxella caviae]
MSKPNFSRFVTTSIAASVMMIMATQARAESFVVNDLAISGLQRVTVESLQTILPIRMGQSVSDSELADSIRALYATGQFSNVQADVRGDQLVFFVTERPTIAEINFEGNRLIPKDGLTEGLKATGLEVGGVLKQSTVHIIETELKNQYISQGYYNSDIKVKQTELDGNRVKLDIEFIEGKAAKIVDINIIGNHYFSDDDIKSELAIKDSNLNPLSKKDRYTQEKFNASLEGLKAKYQNEGFVRFKIDNSALNIDEDKNKVFVEIAVDEGERYQFGDVRFLGKTTYDDDALSELITFKAGESYSQAKLDEATANITNKFGDDGYYYAQIRPISHIDDANRTVNVDYYIDPVRPVYVRRINFSGNIKTKDEVMRREMRQLEGALASNQKIQLSRARLMRTGFFKDVKVETRAVPNSPDQIDLNFIVEEQPSGSSTLAAGYSQSGGITFQVDLSQNNFMGTGNRVTAGFTRSETRESYSLGMTNPFFTENGVSQSVNAYHRKTKYDSKNISNYVLDSYGATLSYGYPINENQRISGGLNFDNTKVRGGPYMGIANVKQLLDDGGKGDYTPIYNENGDITGTDPSFEKDYTTYNAILGWNYSSLDRPVFPTKGMSHEVDLTLGFGDRTFQKVNYRGNAYFPLWKGTILRGWTKLGYGNDLPFYENFYAGGYGSVRGYDASSLGPRSAAYAAARSGFAQRGEKVGGNALASFGAELILPMPFKGDWADQVRPVIFFDAGQVFDTTGRDKETVNIPALTGDVGARQHSNGALSVENYPLLSTDNELRYSAGVGATWYTPIGPISISYAKPLNKKAGDQTENIQFQIGSVF